MESQKIAHLLYVPFTGLGLYNGHRGFRWLRNRIQIFKQFVVPSLEAQTDEDFILWVSWRYEDRNDKDIADLKRYLEEKFKTIFTFSGICFWDDKYPDDIARIRLIEAIHGAMGMILNSISDAETILMTIQPSDDCYHREMVEGVKGFFENNPDYQAVGFSRGYVMDYVNGKIANWNPTTNPPFFTIKFDRKTFEDPRKHVEYTGPYKSHEYVGDKLKYYTMNERAFIVGVHGENISTVFNHPFTGKECLKEVLKEFGLENIKLLKVKTSLRKSIFRIFPYKIQRKLRYLAGEKRWIFRPLFSWIYDSLRS